MRNIGLTGNIGSGKSTVANYFQEFGAKIISADQLARDVISIDQSAYHEIIQLFGKEILLPDLSIDRKKLARIVFNDEKSLKQLNKLTHSEVNKLKKKQISEIYSLNPETTIIYDVPLLFENHMQDIFQKVILVVINYDVQLKRLVEYRKMEIQDIEARLQFQMLQKDKMALADIIIENNSSLAELKSKTKSLYKDILLLPSLKLESIEQ